MLADTGGHLYSTDNTVKKMSVYLTTSRQPINYLPNKTEPGKVIELPNEELAISFEAGNYYGAAWENLHQLIIDRKIIDRNGKWILPSAPPLSTFDACQLIRLNNLLETHYTIKIQLSPENSFEAKISLKEIFSHLKGWDVELVGSGVLYILGREYLTKFLTDLGIPKAKIPLDLFDDLVKIPQDFDFRFIAKGPNPFNIHQGTAQLFRKLAQAFGIHNPNTVKYAIKDKRISEPEDSEQIGFISLPFIENRQTKFKVDFIFVGNLIRGHLHTGTASKIALSLYPNLQCQLVCENYDGREALIHSIIRLMVFERLETTNARIPVHFIIGTIKGKIPDKKDIFPWLYQRFFENDKQFAEVLEKACEVHFGKRAYSFFAAQFNAETFLGREIQQNIPQTPLKFYPEHYFLKSCLQNSRLLKNDISKLRSLITIHAMLGLGDEVSIFERLAGSYLELHCHTEKDEFPLVLFLENDSERAFNDLICEEAWFLIGDLSKEWLSMATFKGTSITATSLQYVDRLFELDSLKAKNLAFHLQITCYSHYPTEEGLEKVFIQFYHIFKQASSSERLQIAQVILSFLRKSQIISKKSISLLETGFVHLCKPMEVESIQISEILFLNGDSKCKNIVLKHLFEYNDVFISKSLMWLKNLAASRIDVCVTLFFAHYLKFKDYRSKTLNLFRQLLILTNKARYPIEEHEISAYLLWVIEGVTHEEDKNILRNILLRNRKLPCFDLINNRLAISTGDSSKADSKQRNLFQIYIDQVKLGKRIGDAKTFLLNALNGSLISSNNDKIEELFLCLLNQLSKKKNQKQILSLLSSLKAQSLFSDKPDILNAQFLSFFQNINTNKQDRQYASFILARSLANPHFDRIYEEAVKVLLSLWDRSVFPVSAHQKNEFMHLMVIVIGKLAKINCSLLIKLLNMCFLTAIDPLIDPQTAVEILELLLSNENSDQEINAFKLEEQDLIELENALLVLVKRCGQEEKKYLNKAAGGLITGFLEKKMTQNAIKWLMRLTSFHPSISCALEFFSKQQMVIEYDQIFKHVKNNNLLEKKAIYEAIIGHPAFFLKNWSLSTNLYLDNFQLIQNEFPQDQLKVSTQELIDGLIASGSPKSKLDLIQIMVKFPFQSKNTWETMLLTTSSSLTRKNISQVWQGFNASGVEVSVAAHLEIIRQFERTNFISQNLLRYLEKESYESSIYYVQATSEERSEFCHLLCNLALREVSHSKEVSIDFKLLYIFWRTYVPNIEEREFIRICMTSPSEKFILNSFKELEKFMHSEGFKPSPSEDLFSAIVKNIPQLEKSKQILYSLQILENKEWEVIISRNEQKNLLLQLVDIALTEFLVHQNQAIQLFSSLQIHWPLIYYSMDSTKTTPFYINILNGFSQLLTLIPLSETREFYNTLIRNVILPQGNQNIEIINFKLRLLVTYNIGFVEGILKMNLKDPEVLFFVYEILDNHLCYIIQNRPEYKTLLKLIYQFMLTYLFSVEDHNLSYINIESTFIGLAKKVIANLERSIHDPEVKKEIITFKIIINKGLSIELLNDKNMTREVCKEYVLKTIALLLIENEYQKTITVPKIQLALQIFMSTTRYLIFSPNDTSKLIKEILKVIPNFIGDDELKLQWILQIRRLIIEYTDETYQGNLSTATLGWWRSLLPEMILHLFKSMTHTQKISQESLCLKNFYSISVSVFEIIKKKEINLCRHNYGEQIYFYLINILYNHKMGLDNKDERTQLELKMTSLFFEFVIDSGSIYKFIDKLIKMTTEKPLDWLIKSIKLARVQNSKEETFKIWKKKLVILSTIYIRLYEHKIFHKDMSYYAKCIEKLIRHLPKTSDDFLSCEDPKLFFLRSQLILPFEASSRDHMDIQMNALQSWKNSSLP